MSENTQTLEENNEVQTKIEDLYNKIQLFFYRYVYDEYGEVTDTTDTSYYARDKHDDIIFAFEGTPFGFLRVFIENTQSKIEDFNDRADYSIYWSLLNITESVTNNGSPIKDPKGTYSCDYAYDFVFNGQPFPVTNPPIDDNLGAGTISSSLNGSISEDYVVIDFNNKH